MYAPYGVRGNHVDNRPFISPRACDQLAKILGKMKGLRAAYLYPVYEGRQFVFVGIVDDMAHSELFNKVSQYSPRRHPPSTQSFSSEQLRVYELQDMVSGLSEWQKSLDLPKQSPPFLQDAVLLPPDWTIRCLELQSLYHSNNMGFLSKLSDRTPIVIFE